MSPEELVSACVAVGDPAAWEEFVSRFQPLISTIVVRTARRLGDPSTATANDLVQETYVKLCADDFRILRNFDSRHSGAFFGFVKVITTNVVRDHFKSQYADKRGAGRLLGSTDSFDHVPVDKRADAQNIERDILLLEIQGQVDACTLGADRDRDRKVFWLYYRAGLSASAISVLPGVGLTTKGVESLILRITRLIRERMTCPGPTDSQHSDGEGIQAAESF